MVILGTTGIFRKRRVDMELKQANAAQYEEILDLYEQVIQRLGEDGIEIYWDLDSYPSRAYFAEAIATGHLYVAEQDGRILGAAVLDGRERPEYAQVPWGIETKAKEALVMHVLGVLPECRGRGVATFMLRDMQRLCREMGARTLRLDALSCNGPACRLYPRVGYRSVIQRTFCIPGVGDKDFEVFEYIVPATGETERGE